MSVHVCCSGWLSLTENIHSWCETAAQTDSHSSHLLPSRPDTGCKWLTRISKVDATHAGQIIAAVVLLLLTVEQIVRSQRAVEIRRQGHVTWTGRETRFLPKPFSHTEQLSILSRAFNINFMGGDIKTTTHQSADLFSSFAFSVSYIDIFSATQQLCLINPCYSDIMAGLHMLSTPVTPSAPEHTLQLDQFSAQQFVTWFEFLTWTL